MSFLAPLLAVFTAACALPILIHLLNKSRFRTISWAAMDFLLKTLQQNKKRLQLRDLLLMILRTAVILFTALALARPTLSSSGLGALGGGGSSATVIVLDTSLSMGAQDGAQSRLDAAKERAKVVAADSARGSSCALVLLSDVATSELTEPTRDMGFISGAIERVTAADGGTRVQAGLAKARELLDKAAGRKEIVLITDLQASGWGPADDPAWRTLVDDLQKSGVNLVIADVSHGPINHVAIDRVACEDDLVTTGDTTTLLVTLRNYGAGVARNLTVEALMESGAGAKDSGKKSSKSQAKKVATTVVTELAPGATAQARLVWKITTAGQHRITVEITPDALPNDHQRFLVLDVLDRLPVLVVDGGVAAPGQWTGGDFLRAALAPVTGDQAAVAGTDAESHGSMAITRITPAELPTANLERFRCVVLTDLDAPSAALADALASRVRAGMGLLLFPGTASRRDEWQRFMGERAKLLPSPIGAPVEHAAGLALATDHLEHPIVAFFTDAEHRPFWAAPRFKKSFVLTMPADDRAVREVGRFADGTPWCLERTVGAGSVLLFASPLDRGWSDFPLRPAFVMAITRAVQHAALGWSSRLAHLTNDPLSVEVPARFGRARIQVSQPDGTQSTITPVPGPNNTLRAAVASTRRSGFYRLWAEGAGSASTELGQFAVNPPAQESDLTTLTRDQAQGRLGQLKAAYVGANEDAEKGLRSSRAGIELWPWLLGLAIACLLSEMFLGQHWAPRDGGATGANRGVRTKSSNKQVAA